MDIILKNTLVTVEIDNAPLVVLGGKKWPVPMLTARQNRVVDPLILQLIPVFEAWQGDKNSALTKLNAANYEALQDIAYNAIISCAPSVTKETFLDLPITLPELISAFTVIAEQTGIFARGEAGEV